jgi:hypothetical protein
VEPVKPDEEAIVAVLGKSHVNEGRLDEDVLALFDDYHASFNLKSKPATHLAALAALSDEQLLEELPEVLTRLVERVREKLADLEYDASKRDGPTDDVENQQRVVQREVRCCRHAGPAGIQAQIRRQGERPEDNNQECQWHYPRSPPPADWSPVGLVYSLYFLLCVRHTQQRTIYAVLRMATWTM